MQRSRFTIAGIMGLVALVAIGFAALRSATPWWASLTFTLAVTLMLTAIVGTVACEGRKRGAWCGAAVFGWAYLAVSFGPWPWLNTAGLRTPPLLTTYTIDEIQALSPNQDAYSEKPPVYLIPGGSLFAPKSIWDVSLGKTHMPVIRVDISAGRQVLHSLWSILLAGFGALVGIIISRPEGRKASR